MNRAVPPRWMLAIIAPALALLLVSCGQSPATPAAAPATAPATSASTAIDFGNDHCMVMPGDEIGKTTLEYNGVLYHFCCPSCLPDFKKDPDKYIKAALADPAKFGLNTPAPKTP